MTDLTNPVQETKRKRLSLKLVSAFFLLCALVGGAVGFANHAYNVAAYNQWPETGTQRFAGDPLMAPNAAIVITCNTGILHVEKVMLVEGKNVIDERIKTVERNSPRQSPDCSLDFDVVNNPDTTFHSLHYVHDDAADTGEWNGWTMSITVYSADVYNTLSVGRFSQDIAVVLITFPDLPNGPEVLNGDNGLPAPPKAIVA